MVSNLESVDGCGRPGSAADGHHLAARSGRRP